jgi:hypothetical protein
MEVLSAILCDAAADYGGKLCMLGSFDTIAAGKFPCHHPHCSVAIRLLVRDEDVGQHALRIVFIGADGHPLIPLQALPPMSFQVPPLAENAFFGSQNFVFNLQGLPAPTPGQCEVRISIDNQLVRTIPFQFIQVQQQQQQQR